jgi:hypothetical protein
LPEVGIPVTLTTPRGTLTFNDGGSYRLSDFQIVRAVRVKQESRSQRDGSIVPDGYRSGANVILEGQIKADTIAARRVAMDALEARVDSLLRADGFLTWTPSGASPRRLASGVRLLDENPIAGAVLKTFHVSLACESAAIVADEERSAATSPLSATGGGSLSFPITFPISFGAASDGGSVAVVNGGDVWTRPVVRIYGPILSPVVRSMTTGQFLSFPGLNLPPGNYVEIDMEAETVLLNGSADDPVDWYLDFEVSEFFDLLPASELAP